jgi:hypothetical protein
MNLDELRLKLTAVFEPSPEGGYTCHFEELPEIFWKAKPWQRPRPTCWMR